MVCTFFGHKDTPDYIAEDLKRAITDLIENKGIDKFYVGNNGNFDRLVYLTLKDLSLVYNISYEVVLAYFPTEKTAFDCQSCCRTP